MQLNPIFGGTNCDQIILTFFLSILFRRLEKFLGILISLGHYDNMC